MNTYKDLLDEKINNFYNYILEIVPNEKHNEIAPLEKIKSNIGLLMLFINKDTIEASINKFAQFFGIEHLSGEQYNKIHEYLMFFLHIKEEMNQKEID